MDSGHRSGDVSGTNVEWTIKSLEDRIAGLSWIDGCTDWDSHVSSRSGFRKGLREAVVSIRAALEADREALAAREPAVPDYSVRCTCEWAHPVDGEVRNDWPAELDPRCAVHGPRPGVARGPAVPPEGWETRWLRLDNDGFPIGGLHTESGRGLTKIMVEVGTVRPAVTDRETENPAMEQYRDEVRKLNERWADRETGK